MTRWCGGEGRFQQTTRLLKPDQASVLAQGRAMPVHFPNTESMVTNVEVFLNIGFEQAGTCWVEILLDTDMKLRYPLRVAQLRPAAGQTDRPA